MASLQGVGDLEVGQNLDYQRRAWRANQIGWVVMALALLAALLGIFGSGPLSSASAGEQGGPLWIEYDRFARYTAPTTLRVHLGPGAMSGGQARLLVDRRYLQSLQLQDISPQPDRVEAAGDDLIYVFNLADPSRPTTIVFSATAHEIGGLAGRIGLTDGAMVSFNQFVYP